MCKGSELGENMVGTRDQWKVGVECGIREAYWGHIVLSFVVCVKDLWCYPKNNGKLLEVFIWGHDQIGVW